MPAHVEITRYGDRVAVICEACDLVDAYTRSDDAQTAARRHNETTHAYPDPLIPDIESETR